MGEEHIRVGAIGPSDGWLGGPKVAEKPEKMPVICETLPPPRKEPISESQSQSDSEDDESGESAEGSGNESVKNSAIPMAARQAPVPELLIFAIPIAICLT